MNPTIMPLPRRLAIDAALVSLPRRDRSATVFHLPHATPAPRPSSAVATLVRTMAGRLRGALAEVRRRRRLRDTHRALCALDARTLRDLGFQRVEIASVAAELYGDTEATRARVLLALGRCC